MSGTERRENTNGYEQREDRIQPSTYDKPQKPHTVNIRRGSEITEYVPQKKDRVTIAIFKKPPGEEATQLTLKDKVLLSQREKHPRPGFEDMYGDRWEINAGKIEVGTDPEQNAAREVEEETQLTGLTFTFLGVIPGEFDIAQKMRKNWVFLTIIDEESSIMLSNEHKAYKWITIEEALSELLAREHNQILEQICLNNGNEALRNFVNDKIGESNP